MKLAPQPLCRNLPVNYAPPCNLPAFRASISTPAECTRPPQVRIAALARQNIRPLFSYSCELLFPQVLYFDNDLRCPGVWGCRSLVAVILRHAANRKTTLFQQLADSSNLLALFFKRPAFVFNRLQTLSPKHPGGGIGTRDLQPLASCDTQPSSVRCDRRH